MLSTILCVREQRLVLGEQRDPAAQREHRADADALARIESLLAAQPHPRIVPPNSPHLSRAAERGVDLPLLLQRLAPPHLVGPVDLDVRAVPGPPVDIRRRPHLGLLPLVLFLHLVALFEGLAPCRDRLQHRRLRVVSLIIRSCAVALGEQDTCEALFRNGQTLRAQPLEELFLAPVRLRYLKTFELLDQLLVTEHRLRCHASLLLAALGHLAPSRLPPPFNPEKFSLPPRTVGGARYSLVPSEGLTGG
mmetsp:Transcript_30818/g.73227  ORF Transcript_30818/g.73227 Transcript_30818/m.73227 type:complete len:249 (+) Transcript_30818:960-1706(+)